MPDPSPDDLSPGGKGPAEGARGPTEGAPATVDPEESHVGAAGDPAEGARDDGEG